MDELLRGNNLEEIQCRATIRASSDGDGAFGKVPVGDTPDDIARCAAAQDVLPVRCPGSDARSVCICELDGGCLVGTNMTVPKGQSVGVNDLDHDGAADTTQFIPGAVALRCGTIDVPADPSMSYWNPSGDQQVPAQGGFDALGPAVVVVPKPPLPTSADCTVVFAPSVVDKDGNQVCAPANGDITAGCTPGDTSAFHFQVEPMGFLPQGVSDPGQSRTSPIMLRAPAAIDPASITGVTVTEGTSTPFTDFTPSVGATTPNILTITWGAGGLAAATRYTITIPTTVTDTYHFGPPQPIQISFTTSAN
jgi:Big-like domain-containing protein